MYQSGPTTSFLSHRDASPLSLRFNTEETFTLNIPLYTQLSFFGITSTRAISSPQISGRLGVDITGFSFGTATAVTSTGDIRL